MATEMNYGLIHMGYGYGKGNSVQQTNDGDILQLEKMLIINTIDQTKFR